MKCFVQVNISNEDSKHGLNETDVIAFIKAVSDFENITIIGLMGMAEFTQDEITELVAFYNTDLGKKLAEKQVGLSQKAMMFGQSWGMEVSAIAQKYN